MKLHGAGSSSERPRTNGRTLNGVNGAMWVHITLHYIAEMLHPKMELTVYTKCVLALTGQYTVGGPDKRLAKEIMLSFY